MRKLYLLLMGILLLVCPEMYAQLGLSITSTGTAFTENFDGMGSSRTATLPTGFRTGNVNGTDWATGVDTTTKSGGTTGTGVLTSSSSGSVYNFANGVTATATDRALGFLNSGSFTSPRSILLKITNNTGSTIKTLAISFDYEKYRSGSRQWDWTFFHGNTSSSATSATDGDQSYASDAGNTVISNPPATISKTVTLTNLAIANGADNYLRWTFTGNGGSSNGQAIGIDNVSITATSAASTDATLSGLAISTGSLTPAFSSSQNTYTATVANAVNTITVTPTATASTATIAVNGTSVNSGSASTPIPLVEGPNTITTVVTAQDGTTIQTFIGVAEYTTIAALYHTGCATHSLNLQCCQHQHFRDLYSCQRSK